MFEEIWEIESKKVLEFELRGIMYNFAQEWEESGGEIGSHLWEASLIFIEHFESLLPSDSSKILELGSGIGVCASVLANCGWEVRF